LGSSTRSAATCSSNGSIVGGDGDQLLFPFLPRPLFFSLRLFLVVTGP
jgi:hypothetical protein